MLRRIFGTLDRKQLACLDEVLGAIDHASSKLG
jgi:hypothetical protein